MQRDMGIQPMFLKQLVADMSLLVFFDQAYGLQLIAHSFLRLLPSDGGKEKTEKG
jgi:hypothetical protein